MRKPARDTLPPRRERIIVEPLSGTDRAEKATVLDLEITLPIEGELIFREGFVRTILGRQEGAFLLHVLAAALKDRCGGKSIVEMIQDALDSVVERLKNNPPSENATDEELDSYERDKGQAQGYAHALAIFFNPYAPDINEQRAQAMERYRRDSSDG